MKTRARALAERSAVLLLLVGVLGVGYLSARVGAAGTFSQLAHRAHEEWTAKPSQVAFLAAEANIQSGLLHSPSNPAALNLRGTLQLAKMRATTAPDAALQIAAQAHQTFRGALQQRPTSPFLWANLALAKLYMDQLDDEFLRALANANRLGPWEPRIQEATVFMGLAAWHRLDAGMRDAVGDAVRRGGKYNADRMLAVLRSYGRLDMACADARYQRIAERDCSSALSPSKSRT